MKEIGLFIQNQLLGMQWLNQLIGSALRALGMDTDSRLTVGLQFFIYDVIKIVILLCVLIFLVSYIQSFFLRRKVSKSLVDLMVLGLVSCLLYWGQ